MFDHEKPMTIPTELPPASLPRTDVGPLPDAVPEHQTASSESAAVPEAGDRWHAEAGRKGARRVHQLIEEGKLYEEEHGLKRGRQRIRQLIELGKRYEQEHGLQPERPRKRGKRLARGQRKELLATLVRCLMRLAKPSYRADLDRLLLALQREENQAA